MGRKLLLLLLFPLLTQAAIYRWVDRHGGVHYSDRQQPGAVQINIPGVQSATPSPNTTLPPTSNHGQPANSVAPAAAPPPANTAPPVQEESVNYSIAITDPTDQETIPTGDRYAMPVHVSVKPKMKKNQQVVILLDGKPVPDARGARTSFTLSNIDRGEHTLQAKLIDVSENNQETTSASSERITIYIRQTSILNR